jgi:amidophosphoribosyltransferase
MGGFFGAISHNDTVHDVFFGTDYHSHLGTRRGGMVAYDSEKGFQRSIHSIENSPFRTKFEKDVEAMRGKVCVGCISDTDPQPILVNSHLGRYAVVTVAKINNIEDIAQELLDRRMHFSEYSANTINQTELVALLINMGRSFVEGINLVYRKIEGSCSMLILTEKGIIAARDFLGRTPIVIGQKDGAYAVSSETTSFPNLDYKRVRDLGPGEIVYLTADNVEVLQEPWKREQICSFLWVYYGFPASDYNGINVENVRETNGKMMGEKDDAEVDCVCGVPDSGVGMALGYAEGKGVPYKRAVLKYTPTWPRSFTPGNQERRSLVAKMKLIPNPALLKDQRVVFCDDSIVRGTQLKDNVKTFFEYGAKEVHCRISCPPLVYGCPFIGFTSSKSDMELITRRIIKDFEGDDKKNLEKYAQTDSPEYQRMVDEIAKRLGLTSLKFAKLEDLIKSIGMDKCRVCTHCFDGSSYCHEHDKEDDRQLKLDF